MGVGLSLAVLLSKNHEVIAVDIVPEKAELINRRISPIHDTYIERFFREEKLNLCATTDSTAAYKDAEMVIIATPTDYDSQKNFLMYLQWKS